MYHIPIGMEMFSAEDEDQWEIIRRTIEVSDYYVLVLGLRYGSKTSGGISFTQKEYEYALEKNIPILAFVMDEMASLPKDKRDDDLSEINRFRETVLKNSKMAQFWKTKDELIKNISISLMKQIMQKPGIGWIRGDEAISEEALANEIANLSKENRELREKIDNLESKLSPKSPEIELQVEPAPLVVDNEFDFEETIVAPEKISISDVDDHLRQYVSEKEIQEFNDNIPSQDEVNGYNAELVRHNKIIRYSSPLTIKVCNSGTIKANNLYIDIVFPKEIFVFETNDEVSKPENPIPVNPIKTAQIKYKKDLESKNALSRIFRDPMEGIGSIMPHNLEIPRITPINQTWWTRLEGNKLTIKIESLLHTRCMTFDDEYLIAPLASGKHKIEVNIICEELEKQENRIIEIETNVQDTL
jgi:hypothetical protein